MMNPYQDLENAETKASYIAAAHRKGDKSEPLLPALWFSRHEPTPDQLKEIEDSGFRLVEVKTGKYYGSKAMNDWSDVNYVKEALKNLIKLTGAWRIYGVVPAPFRAYPRIPFRVGKVVALHEAWNINRNGAFEHYRFVQTGTMCLAPDPEPDSSGLAGDASGYGAHAED